jgi:hypothetical protein
MQGEPDPVPSYFGLRYIMWFLWCNAITLLSAVQLGVAALLLLATDDHALFTKTQFIWIAGSNAFLTGAIAVIKKNNPPSSAPTKGQ